MSIRVYTCVYVCICVYMPLATLRTISTSSLLSLQAEISTSRTPRDWRISLRSLIDSASRFAGMRTGTCAKQREEEKEAEEEEEEAEEEEG